MVTKEEAFLSDLSKQQLIDPRHLNSGVLQDIYAERDDDFIEPESLEVTYKQDGRVVNEIMFVELLHGSDMDSPRIIVSVKAVKAMHRAIAVLTRKLDNVLITLRSCRHHYYKELTHLRDVQGLTERGALGKDSDVVAKHMAQFFSPGQYQDEVTVELFQERLQEATMELEERLLQRQKEISKLQSRLTRWRRAWIATTPLLWWMGCSSDSRLTPSLPCSAAVRETSTAW
jgi:hypothetical protein